MFFLLITGGLFYLVNGPDATERAVQGFIVNANDLSIVSTFQAGDSQLSNPHDIAVSPDGESVYVVQLDPHRVLKFVHKGMFFYFFNVLFFLYNILCMCDCVFYVFYRS